MAERLARTVSILLCLLLLPVGAATAGQDRDVKQYRKLQKKIGRYQADGKFQKAAKFLQKQASVAPEDSGVFYNLACARSLAGDTDAAFEALTTAVERGWMDADHTREDSDLEPLLDDPRMEPLLERMEQSGASWKERSQRLHTTLDPAQAASFDSVDDLIVSFDEEMSRHYKRSVLLDWPSMAETEWNILDRKVASLQRFLADDADSDEADRAGIEILRTALAYNEYRDPWGEHDGGWAYDRASWFLATFPESDHLAEAMLVAGQSRLMSAPVGEDREETADEVAARRREADKHLAALIGEHPGSVPAAKACMWRMRIAYERAGKTITPEVDEHYQAFCTACDDDDDVLDYAWERARGPLFELESADFKGQGLDGEELSLDAMKGKVVLVDFWATWCGPCIGELPHLKEAYERYRAQGFEIVGVSLDDDDREAFLAELQDREISWPQIYDGKGWEAELARRYRVSGIPTMILLDRDGRVAEVNLRGDKLVDRIGELIGGEGSGAAAAAAGSTP